METDKYKRRTLGTLGVRLTQLALASLPFAAMAQTPAAPAWPSRPVTVVVPFAPGGGTDIAGRLLAVRLGQKWGQTVVVDNRTGAGGVVGAELVAKAKPDGYTLLIGNVGTQSINPSLYKLTYDADKAFAPISLFAELPFAFVVNPNLPAKTPKELIALAKAAPDKYTYASSGSGGSPHLTAEIFQQATGVKFVHVPYKGGGPAMSDLMAGHVDMLFASILETSGYVKTGKLRALAVTSPQRSPAMPEVPTLAEHAPGAGRQDRRRRERSRGDRRHAQGADRAGRNAARQHAGRTAEDHRRGQTALWPGHQGRRREGGMT
jgi:tripartite-type tricarboxylate transporter receptor subunit TctC